MLNLKETSEKIKTQLRRARYFWRKDYITPRNIVTVGGILMIIYFTGGALSMLSRNWSLEEKLSNLRLEKTRMEVEIETLELERQYYKSDEYKELIARTKQGKIAPGETMVTLPDNSNEAKSKYRETNETTRPYRSNFSRWIEFLFGLG
ncbi:hypothetical protein IKF15_01850 [Candidatus Saccharibacteria bacterium]|nr:hypothetical protein [Candidatus Saccharibacteria bacterium]